MTNKDDKQFLKDLGSRITQIRIQNGLTQVELGNRIDVEKPSINRIEKGNTNPTTLTLRKICKELNITLEQLFQGLR